jgi:hypothetical protein
LRSTSRACGKINASLEARQGGIVGLDRVYAVLAIVLATAACTSPPLRPIPPDAPQSGETIIGGEDDPVTIQCAGDFDGSWVAPSPENPRRVIVTSAPEWGTVWRADAAPYDEPGNLWRIVCWRDGTLLRPLEMTDASRNIPPLP